MKKILFTAALFLCAFLQAQISVTTNGNPITNDQTFTYSTLGTGAKLPFIVTNTSGETIYLKIRVENIENSNGASFQLCFGTLCYFSIIEGNNYPNNALALEPGQSNTNGDHFWNYNAGDGQTAMDFRFTFIQTTSTGAFVADLLSVNYRYEPQLSVNDVTKLQSIGIRNINTLVGNQLNIDAAEASKMEIFSLSGQLVRQQKIAAVSQSIDVSDLAPAAYIVRFTTDANQSAQVKILKK